MYCIAGSSLFSKQHYQIVLLAWVQLADLLITFETTVNFYLVDGGRNIPDIFKALEKDLLLLYGLTTIPCLVFFLLESFNDYLCFLFLLDSVFLRFFFSAEVGISNVFFPNSHVLVFSFFLNWVVLFHGTWSNDARFINKLSKQA